MNWLDPMEPDDALAQLLTDWRDELDEQASTVMSTELPALPGRPRRWLRAHQRTAAATAIVVALAGSTTVAAAASGSSGPLGGVHDLLYGPAKPAVDHLALRAARVLDTVASQVRAAQRAGAISEAARAHLAHELTEAQTLLNRDEHAAQRLRTRLTRLREALAAIPAPAPPASVSPQREHGGHDGPDAGGPGDDNHADGQGNDSQRDGQDGGQDDGQSGRGGSDDGSGDSGNDSARSDDQSQDSEDGGDSTNTDRGDRGDDSGSSGDGSGQGGGDDGSSGEG